MTHRNGHKAEEVKADVEPNKENLWIIGEDKKLKHANWIVTVK